MPANSGFGSVVCRIIKTTLCMYRTPAWPAHVFEGGENENLSIGLVRRYQHVKWVNGSKIETGTGRHPNFQTFA